MAKDWLQCLNKWKQLQQMYKDIRDGSKITGTPLYIIENQALLEDMLGSKASVQPRFIMSSLDENATGELRPEHEGGLVGTETDSTFLQQCPLDVSVGESNDDDSEDVDGENSVSSKEFDSAQELEDEEKLISLIPPPPANKSAEHKVNKVRKPSAGAVAASILNLMETDKEEEVRQLEVLKQEEKAEKARVQAEKDILDAERAEDREERKVLNKKFADNLDAQTELFGNLNSTLLAMKDFFSRPQDK